MLRLQHSEIGITPDDVRLVSERLDLRKRDRDKVKLLRSLEQSRDEAVTSCSHGQWAPSAAEHVSGDRGQSQTAKARAKTRLTAPFSSKLHSDSERRGQRVQLAPPVQFDVPSSTLFSLPYRLTSNVQTFQPQLDGQFNIQAQPLQPMEGLWTRNGSTSSQLLQSRPISASSFSHTGSHSPKLRVHSHHSLCESAIVFELGESSNPRSSDETNTSGGRPPNANNGKHQFSFRAASIYQQIHCRRTSHSQLSEE